MSLLCISCERSIFGFWLCSSAIIYAHSTSPHAAYICPPKTAIHTKNTDEWLCIIEKHILLKYDSDSADQLTLMIFDSKITMCDKQDQANGDNYDNDD